MDKTIIDSEETEPASGAETNSLDDILNDLKPLESVNERVSVRPYEDGIAVWLTYEASHLRKRLTVPHLAFTIDQQKNVKHNAGYIAREGHPECIDKIEDYLIANGYSVDKLVIPEKKEQGSKKQYGFFHKAAAAVVAFVSYFQLK